MSKTREELVKIYIDSLNEGEYLGIRDGLIHLI